MKSKKIQKMEKGQVAFEFLIIYVVFMVAFIAAVYVSAQRAIYQQIYAEQVYAREIGVRFAQEINTAARFPGYEKMYSFSDKIKGTAYELNISNGVLMLFYKNTGIFYYPLMTTNISINGYDTGTASRAINITIGSMNVTNKNGEIKINQ